MDWSGSKILESVVEFVYPIRTSLGMNIQAKPSQSKPTLGCVGGNSSKSAGPSDGIILQLLSLESFLRACFPDVHLALALLTINQYDRHRRSTLTFYRIGTP